MKKLICAAVVAGSMFALAEEAAQPSAAPVDAVKVAEKAPMPKRPHLTPEQREKIKEHHAKFEAERKARMEKREASMLEVIKKYGLDDEKAKALLKDLQEAMKMGRRMSRRPRPMPRPAKAAPEAQSAAEAK